MYLVKIDTSFFTSLPPSKHAHHGIYIYKSETQRLYYIKYALFSTHPPTACFDIQPYLCNCYYSQICIDYSYSNLQNLNLNNNDLVYVYSHFIYNIKECGSDNNRGCGFCNGEFESDNANVNINKICKSCCLCIPPTLTPTPSPTPVCCTDVNTEGEYGLIARNPPGCSADYTVSGLDTNNMAISANGDRVVMSNPSYNVFIGAVWVYDVGASVAFGPLVVSTIKEQGRCVDIAACNPNIIVAGADGAIVVWTYGPTGWTYALITDGLSRTVFDIAISGCGDVICTSEYIIVNKDEFIVQVNVYKINGNSSYVLNQTLIINTTDYDKYLISLDKTASVLAVAVERSQQLDIYRNDDTGTSFINSPGISGISGDISSIALSPCGNCLAVGTIIDTQIYIYDYNISNMEWKLNKSTPITITIDIGFEYEIRSIALSDCGNICTFNLWLVDNEYTNYGTYTLLRTNGGYTGPITKLPGPTSDYPSNFTGLGGVDISYDGKTISAVDYIDCPLFNTISSLVWKLP